MSRLTFSQNLLRLELLAKSFHMRTRYSPLVRSPVAACRLVDAALLTFGPQLRWHVLLFAAGALTHDGRCGELQANGHYVYNFRSVAHQHQFGEDAGDGYADDLHDGANRIGFAYTRCPHPISQLNQ